ncbi:hypothetical protein C8R47DRAFT_6689 [Mycena vitilis]|nr:hypothetical protein C8R47DRAFT_6689 [Mycena vitilis]
MPPISPSSHRGPPPPPWETQRSMSWDPPLKPPWINTLPSDEHTSAFFLRSRQFKVSGGTFTNVTNIYRTRDPPSDFRVIPLGDLDLLDRKKGRFEVVTGRTSARKLYTARIPALQSKVTAAVYEGDGAEEEWREAILRYLHLRHPYLIQLYGIVNTQNFHAALFHDDLIPYEQLKDKYYNSHLSTVYFWACLHTMFSDVNSYMQPFLRRDLVTMT